MNNSISDKDKKDWKNFLSKNDKLPDKDLINSKSSKRKTLLFDLHGYSLEEANRKMNELIPVSYEKGIGKLIIVTGKGLHSKNEIDPYVSKDLGILRYSVPEYINNNDHLLTFVNEIKEASIEDGGSGAFYIYLKKRPIK